MGRKQLVLALSQPRSGCVRVRAGSALLYPGPLWRGGRVEESPQDGRHGCRPVFRRYTDVPSKNPVTRPRTCRAGCPEGAPSGCHFSLATFSLGTQRESSSGAGRRTKSLCRLRKHRSKSPLAPTLSPNDEAVGGEGERQTMRCGQWLASHVLNAPTPSP